MMKTLTVGHNTGQSSAFQPAEWSAKVTIRLSYAIYIFCGHISVE